MIDKLQVPPSHPDFLAHLNRRLEALADLRQVPATVEATKSGTGFSGSHAQRLSVQPYSLPLGATFWEVERTVLYVVASDGNVNRRIWRYASGEMIGTVRPTDLGEWDEGFLFTHSTYGHTWRWSFASGWQIVRGLMRGVLSSLPSGFGTAATNFRFWATDYYRMFRWTGAAWTYDDGELPARFVTLYPGTVPPGWAVCDGSAVTVTTSAGITGSYTTENLIGAYLKGGVYAAGIVPQVAPTIADHPAGVTGAGGAGFNAGAGGTSVSTTGHTHTTPSLSHSVTSSGEPQHAVYLPIVKL